MEIPLVTGRKLTAADLQQQGNITRVVVNQAFVRKFLPNDDPLGKTFDSGRQYKKAAFEIVGVDGDTKYRSLREVPPPIYYVNGSGAGAFFLHVHTQGDPSAILAPLRELLHSIDPQLPFHELSTLRQDIDRSLWTERLLAVLASAFSAFAVLLSGAGLYACLAYFAASRRREIGLRLALGARSENVIWLVAQRVLPSLCAGIAIGVAMSYPAGVWARSVLYGVQPFDTRSATSAVALLLAIGAAAALVPVIRALRVDPAVALRHD